MQRSGYPQTPEQGLAPSVSESLPTIRDIAGSTGSILSPYRWTTASSHSARSATLARRPVTPDLGNAVFDLRHGHDRQKEHVGCIVHPPDKASRATGSSPEGIFASTPAEMTLVSIRYIEPAPVVEIRLPDRCPVPLRQIVSFDRYRHQQASEGRDPRQALPLLEAQDHRFRLAVPRNDRWLTPDSLIDHCRQNSLRRRSTRSRAWHFLPYAYDSHDYRRRSRQRSGRHRRPKCRVAPKSDILPHAPVIRPFTNPASLNKVAGVGRGADTPLPIAPLEVQADLDFNLDRLSLPAEPEGPLEQWTLPPLVCRGGVAGLLHPTEGRIGGKVQLNTGTCMLRHAAPAARRRFVPRSGTRTSTRRLVGCRCALPDPQG